MASDEYALKHQIENSMNLSNVKLHAACTIAAFAFLVSSESLYAQPDGVKFGKVTAQDFAVNEQQWPNAEAVALFDVGRTRFEYDQQKGFYTKFVRQTRIKILSESGLDWADVELPYYESKDGKEVISAVKASTYNMVGGAIQETKMDRNAVFEEKVDKNRRKLKFTLPNVQVGSVIEFTFEINSDFLASLPTWYFQHTIPCVWNELEVEIPEYFNYSQLMVNRDPFEKAATGSSTQSVTFIYTENLSKDPKLVNNRSRSNTVNFQNTRWTWVQENIPSFGNEPYVANIEDHLEHIKFSLSSASLPSSGYQNVTPTWPKLVQGLNEDPDFGKYADKASQLDEWITSDIRGISDTLARAAAVYQLVQKQFKWNEQYRIFAEQPMNDLLKKRTGNSAELNFLLIGLLRQAGLEAYPIMLSTRSNGRPNRLIPLLREYNHVVTCLIRGDNAHYFDASNALLPPEILGPECFNGEGVLITQNNYFWLPLAGNFKEVAYHSISAKLTDAGLEGQISMGYKGFSALNMRNHINSESAEAAAKKDLERLLVEGSLSDVNFEPANPREASVKGTMKFSAKGFVEGGDPMLYIDPRMGFGFYENPFKSPDRKFEVDFGYPYEETVQFIFDIPQGYELVETPATKRIAWEDGSLKFDYLADKTASQVRITYRFTRKKSVFPPEQYKDLREFYDQVVAISSGQVVLKKLP